MGNFFSLFNKKNKSSTDNPIEDIINSIEDRPFAISTTNVMYAGFGELGGYHFIQTIVIGDFKVKTFNGGKLQIHMNDFELILDSDSTELVSEHSDVSGRLITRIDFQIEEKDIKKIESSRPVKITLEVDKKNAEFEIYIEEKNTN